MVALALEDEQLVVSEAVKFPRDLQTTSGIQTHRHEVDLVAAHKDTVVLASVKSASARAGSLPITSPG
jgi:hypothetical protein